MITITIGPLAVGYLLGVLTLPALAVAVFIVQTVRAHRRK